MNTEPKQRLTQLTQAEADELLLQRENIGAPHVLSGHDGSYWVLSDELRAYRVLQDAESVQ